MPQISLLSHEVGKLQVQSQVGHDAMSDHDSGKKPISSAFSLINFDHVPYSCVMPRDWSRLIMSWRLFQLLLLLLLLLYYYYDNHYCYHC